MKADTIEQIKSDIERLSAEIKADREARGLPEEPPPDFVSVAMAWTLFERCRPLHMFAINYTHFCDKANEVLPLTEKDITWAQSFRPYTELIREVKDQTILKVLGGSLDGLISMVEKHGEYESASDLVRSMFINLDFLEGEYHPPRLSQFTWKWNANKEENAKYSAEIHAEYERLKDEKYFDAEYKKLREYYESIKHLY